MLQFACTLYKLDLWPDELHDPYDMEFDWLYYEYIMAKDRFDHPAKI